MDEEDNIEKNNDKKIGFGLIIGIVCASIFGVVLLVIIPITIIIILNASNTLEVSNSITQNTLSIDSIIPQSSTSRII